MIVKIAMLVIGLLLLVAGVYYLRQNREDAESRKIYGIAALIGGVLAVAGVLALLL